MPSSHLILCLFILFKLLILGCPFCILAVCGVLFIVACPHCVWVCTCVSQHHQAINLILRVSTWRWHPIPQAQPPRTAPTSKVSHKPGLSPPLLSSCLLIGGSHAPFLSQTSETFHSLDQWFIMQRCNSGTAQGERCTGSGRGKERRATLAPGTPLSSDLQPESSQTLSLVV